jgi:alanine-glyoxylate transaminase/serine-glyoxylate transaminase/serine-pyruvate transaminase
VSSSCPLSHFVTPTDRLDAPVTVLYQNAHPSNSHMAPDFAAVVQDCLQKTQQVLYTKDAQIFLVAGSGTLGWDMVASNLVEPGENVLLTNTGYFGDG